MMSSLGVLAVALDGSLTALHALYVIAAIFLVVYWINRARKARATPAQPSAVGFWLGNYILVAIAIGLVSPGYHFLFLWKVRDLREIAAGIAMFLLGLGGIVYVVFRVRRYRRANPRQAEADTQR